MGICCNLPMCGCISLAVGRLRTGRRVQIRLRGVEVLIVRFVVKLSIVCALLLGVRVLTHRSLLPQVGIFSTLGCIRGVQQLRLIVRKLFLSLLHVHRSRSGTLSKLHPAQGLQRTGGG